jgi:hypothetical protein
MHCVDSVYTECNTGNHEINRDLIDKALNVFETDTKCVLENNFDKEKGVILEQESEITSKIADLKHNQYQIGGIS